MCLMGCGSSKYQNLNSPVAIQIPLWLARTSLSCPGRCCGYIYIIIVAPYSSQMYGYCIFGHRTHPAHRSFHGNHLRGVRCADNNSNSNSNNDNNHDDDDNGNGNDNNHKSNKYNDKGNKTTTTTTQKRQRQRQRQQQ